MCVTANARTVDAERPNPSSFRGVRQHPVESHTEGQRLKPWTREGRPLFRHPREAGIPHAGQSSTTSLPRQNHPGDSRARRENDSNIFRAVAATLVEPTGGFFACWRRL